MTETCFCISWEIKVSRQNDWIPLARTNNIRAMHRTHESSFASCIFQWLWRLSGSEHPHCMVRSLLLLTLVLSSTKLSFRHETAWSWCNNMPGIKVTDPVSQRPPPPPECPSVQNTDSDCSWKKSQSTMTRLSHSRGVSQKCSLIINR